MRYNIKAMEFFKKIIVKIGRRLGIVLIVAGIVFFAFLFERLVLAIILVAVLTCLGVSSIILSYIFQSKGKLE